MEVVKDGLRTIAMYLFYHLYIKPKRFFNLLKGFAVEDNPRNQEIVDYCISVYYDPTIEPSTPVQHWFELRTKEDFEDQNPDANFYDFRQAIYGAIAYDMLQMPWMPRRD